MEKINRLEVILVEQDKTGKWLEEFLGKNEAFVSGWCTNIKNVCKNNSNFQG